MYVDTRRRGGAGGALACPWAQVWTAPCAGGSSASPVPQGWWGGLAGGRAARKAPLCRCCHLVPIGHFWVVGNFLLQSCVFSLY